MDDADALQAIRMRGGLSRSAFCAMRHMRSRAVRTVVPLRGLSTTACEEWLHVRCSTRIRRLSHVRLIDNVRQNCKE
jgi:hypothetical protein